jgi:hypothetical protein
MLSSTRAFRFLIAVCLLGVTTTRATLLDSAKKVPQDAFMVVSIESIDQLTEAIKQTAFYQLFNDPAMKPFVETLKAKSQAHLQTDLKTLWRKIGLQRPPEHLPLPHGELILQFFLDTDTSDARRKNKSQDKQPNSPFAALDDVSVHFVGLADMGADIKDIQRIVKARFAKASTDQYKRQKKRFRGTEIFILEDVEDTDPYNTVCFGTKGRRLIIASSLSHLQSVLTQMDRGTANSLASTKGFTALAREFKDSQIFCFIHAHPVRQFIMSHITDPGNQWKANNAMVQLGLDTLLGLSYGLSVGATRKQELYGKSLLLIDGEKRGIPALLTPSPMSLKADTPLLTHDLATFITANYDPGALFDQVALLVKKIAAVDITYFTNMAMVKTGGTNGQPPIDLRKDVLDQLPGPLTLTWTMREPYHDANNSETLVGIRLRDAEALDTTLARIHQTYLASMDPKLQRSLLNHTLYLLPGLPLPSPFLPFNGSDDMPPKQLGLSLTENHLVLGQTDVVEQQIRNDKRSQTKTIHTHPMYKYARPSMPPKAIGYLYRNEQIYYGVMWERAKPVIARLQKEAQDTPTRTDDPDDPTGHWKAMLDSLDFDRLPPFERIRKYFGPRIGYLTDHPLGICYEEVLLKPMGTP